MPTYKWTTLKKPTKNSHDYPSLKVSTHPLKVEVINVKQSMSKNFIDSINKWTEAFEEADPLLKFEQAKDDEDLEPIIEIDTQKNYSQVWSKRRANILNKFTTGEKLTIVSSFLPGGEKALIRQVSNLNEKVKHRLEQLDEFDEGSIRKTIGLSQQEFVGKINMLDEEIKKAWDTEQRVKAFKICIQCSKLLSDFNVMQFYPSKFILICDILDNFGNLVFNRLKNKSNGDNIIKSPMDIDPSQVPESAKETCQNWMFKMASIRELLPRLYMEMSLLKCYVFINKNDIKLVIKRLTTMIRGIANPLVAVYLRVYLCNVAAKLLGKDSEEYFYENLKEFLEDYEQIFHPMMTKKYGAQLLTQDQYLNLYEPAVNWLMFGTLNYHKYKHTLLEDFLNHCDELENKSISSELFLACILSSFDSQDVIENSSRILEMIQKSADKMVLLSPVLCGVGEHVCRAGAVGAAGARRLPAEALSQTWWKIATNIKSTASFLHVLEPWIQFACTQLSTQHTNIILRGTIRFMLKCGKPTEEFSSNFHLVVKRMLKSIPDVEELFLMDAFMPLLELYSKYVNVVFRSLATVEDEMKVCSDLIIKLVWCVYHEEAEQQLAFYVDCRAAFIKLDAVLQALVHAVNALSCRAGGAVGVVGAVGVGAGGRGGRWVSRACAAYCCVTAPSLRCVLARAQLYLLSGQTALLNGCIGQAEANFKALVGIIPNIPQYIKEDGQDKPTHDRLAGLLSNFLSTLLILPDNVDSNRKAYVLSGFIKVLERVQWKKTEPLYYNLLLKTLDLLCHMTREKYIYTIDSVISNDELYGSEEEFVECIEKYATHICQEILVVLKMLGDNKETKKQYNLALELFWRVVRRGEVSDPAMSSLAANLWMLAHKLQDCNKYAKSMLTTLEADNNPAARQLLNKLTSV
ncbi:PREDICTED: UPF0505 protein C16orf62 homolog [Papilio polytes]|uniref:UPF0505 protein C16orf62 homolog n=1 Tax=Papilio polytes TaxID=76194 RepID=UPI0006766420|nr:PREDICTED: UPF0505 protein C16orf62 homolog [Papilio polytes]